MTLLSYKPKTVQKALFFLHGYGTDGQDLYSMAPMLSACLPDTAFFFPTAKEKTPSGFGFEWFPLPSFESEGAVDFKAYDVMMKGALKSAKSLQETIKQMQKELSLPFEKISVAGFSQGGLVALLTGLTAPFSLSKSVSLSGVPLLLSKDFSMENIKNKPAVFLSKGTEDDVLPTESLSLTEKTLLDIGITPESHLIEGLSHGINEEVFSLMIEFLKKEKA